MKQINGSSLLVLACALNQCTSEPGGQYQAPRKPGESVLTWSNGSAGSGSSLCPENQFECSAFYLGTGFKPGWVEAYDYIAVLDFDYDPRPEEIEPGQLLATRLKVYGIVEEFVNRIPGKKWNKVYVFGTCDGQGHCIMHEGQYPMPLWSGQSLIMGYLICRYPDDGEAVLRIMEAYAVEENRLYDFFGFDYDWNTWREWLRDAGAEAMKTKPVACASQPLPPPSDEGPPPGDGPDASVALPDTMP